MRAGWCQHYNGLVGGFGESREGRRCKAGVLYDEVKQLPVPGRGWRLPCLGDPDTECAAYEAITAEMEAESLRVAGERLQQHFAVVASGHCPHCGREMTQKKIGRCMYAKPCGHRLNEIASEIRGLEFVNP